MTAILAPAFSWLAAGMLVGGLYWSTLRWSVERLAAGRSLLMAIAVQFVRFAVLGVALVVVAIHWGVLALLLSAGGVMVARAVVLRLPARG